MPNVTPGPTPQRPLRLQPPLNVSHVLEDSTARLEPVGSKTVPAPSRQRRVGDPEQIPDLLRGQVLTSQPLSLWHVFETTVSVTTVRAAA